MITRLLVLCLSAAPEAKLDAVGDFPQLSFTDKAGAHFVRFQLSVERTRQKDDSVLRSRDLLVVHTVGKKEVWRAKDFVDACEFDLTLELLEGSIEVTDLDDDGEPEISFLYQLACRSDVSPKVVKLLMYEGATKYALRGESREQVGEHEFMGGDFKADPAFARAPPKFLEFARAKWKAKVVEAK